jgi:hypothetical protein
MMDSMPPLYTSRYQSFDPAWGVPVAITRGLPRGNWFRYPLERICELAPTRELFAIEDPAAFEAAYRAQLDGHGRELLADRFREISDGHGGKPLVLLCYEDLTRAGEWCHREIFSALWREWTGQEVAEIQAGG